MRKLLGGGPRHPMLVSIVSQAESDDDAREHNIERDPELLRAMHVSKAGRICQYNVSHEKVRVNLRALSGLDA